MSNRTFPPELAAHVAVITVSSSGVDFRAEGTNRHVALRFCEYFSSLQLTASFYGRYYAVTEDGLDDDLYQRARPYELPLLTVCKRVGQQGVFLLPTFELLDGQAFATIEQLRKVDRAFLEKQSKLGWYGGLSGPMSSYSARIRFVNEAPAILQKIGLPHDIRFTHLFGRDQMYRPEMGRYVPGLVGREDQVLNRYLVALDGNTYPSSLHWNLAVRSLLFRQRSRWHCFYDDFFFAGVDYLDFECDLGNFETQVQFALEHEQDAGRIVLNSTLKSYAIGHRFVDDWARENLQRALERS